MTRKDYIRLAEDLAIHARNGELPRGVLDTICDALKRDNGNFDRGRFLAAVGIE